jgi:hypothetical protein
MPSFDLRSLVWLLVGAGVGGAATGAVCQAQARALALEQARSAEARDQARQHLQAQCYEHEQRCLQELVEERTFLMLLTGTKGEDARRKLIEDRLLNHGSSEPIRPSPPAAPTRPPGKCAPGDPLCGE